MHDRGSHDPSHLVVLLEEVLSGKSANELPNAISSCGSTHSQSAPGSNPQMNRRDEDSQEPV